MTTKTVLATHINIPASQAARETQRIIQERAQGKSKKSKSA